MAQTNNADSELDNCEFNATIMYNLSHTAYMSIELDVWFHRILYKTLVPILFGAVIVIGLIGNSMVMCVIISKKKMRTTVNLLLLNLALSDLTFLSVCVPFVTYHYAADNWNMGELMCKLSQFLLYVTVYVTIYTLILIAAVRFFTVVYPTTSVRLRTKRDICMVIGAIWAIMIVVNVPILLVYRVKQFPVIASNVSEEVHSIYMYCGVENRETGQLLFLTFFILTYLLPLSVITTFNFLIMKFLHRASRNNSLHSSNRSNASRLTGCERKSHVTRILMSVCLVFGICWLPLHAHLLVVYFQCQPKNKIYEIFRVMCHCLAYANSSMNPIIYNYVSKDFRTSFKELFSTYKSCKPKYESDFDLRIRNSPLL